MRGARSSLGQATADSPRVGKSDYRSRSACGQALTRPAASGGRPAQYNRIDLARDELPIIQVRQQLAALDDHLAAQDGRHRPSLDLPSLPRVADVEVVARSF